MKRATKKAAKKAPARSKRPKKTTAKTTVAASTVPLVPQPHGGALKAGGTPGNVGGTGRPKAELRATLRDFASEKLPDFRAKWDALTPDQQVRALDLALKYGVGTQSETVLSDDDIRAWEGHVARYLYDTLTAHGWTREDVGALLSGLDEHMRAFDPRERTK